MAGNALVDAAFLVALLTPRDTHHKWAVSQAALYPRPWQTCEAGLSEAFYMLGQHNAPQLIQLLRRNTVVPSSVLAENCEAVLHLMHKYTSVPMSLADACLVRMTETMESPIVLTTDSDFRIYRRHSRQAIPVALPS